jgi:hypothetical protein
MLRGLVISLTLAPAVVVSQVTARRRGGRLAGLLVGCGLAALLGGAPALANPAASPLITRFAGTGTGGPEIVGPAINSPLATPAAVAVSAGGDVYIGDGANQVVEQVSPAGQLSVIAGNGIQGAPTAGTATASHLNGPYGLAVDAAGNVYIADTQNRVVEKVTPAGQLSIIAGDGIQGAPTAGTATASHLNDPYGLAVDAAGNVYIADQNNHVVEKVTRAGQLSIFAGSGTSGTPTAGPATSSPLHDPSGVAVDASGNVYISDGANHVIEEVTPGGTLSIFAGDGTSGAPTAGPATSSHLSNPLAVVADSRGNVYIVDIAQSEIDEVAPDGTLSIVAGDGTAGAPSYGGPATSSELRNPQAADVTAGGTIYIADTINQTIDQVAPIQPAAGSPPAISGTKSVAQTLTASVGSWTNSPTSFSYQWQDCSDFGAHCVDIAGATSARYTLTSGDVGSTIRVVVTAGNDGGSMSQTSQPSAVVQATLKPPVTPVAILAPVSTLAPVISGPTLVGDALTCSDGSWTNRPTAFSYRWNRDGSMLAGALAQTYIVQAADEGNTLTCTVTAANAGGSATSSSGGVRVIAVVSNQTCPVPTGALAGPTLGPLALGDTRRHARQLLPRFAVITHKFDNFCLAGGWGIRAGYASNMLLRTIARSHRARMSGRILLALTANRFYALEGVRPGTRLASARARLKLRAALHIGVNYWYIIAGVRANGVLKVRDAIIQEVGTVNKSLSTGRAAQRRLLTSF